MKNILDKIALLERRVNSKPRSFSLYKEQHPKTKKNSGDDEFQLSELLTAEEKFKAYKEKHPSTKKTQADKMFETKPKKL